MMLENLHHCSEAAFLAQEESDEKPTTQLAVRFSPLEVDSRLLTERQLIYSLAQELGEKRPFLSLQEVESPEREMLGKNGREYKILLASICGSDRKLVKLGMGRSAVFDLPDVTPGDYKWYQSFMQGVFHWDPKEGRRVRRFTLGHQLVVVNEEGEIGVLNPYVTCLDKFAEAPDKHCWFCQHGQENFCQHVMEGPVKGRGIGFGAVAVDKEGKVLGELGGGLSDGKVVAYETQFIPLSKFSGLRPRDAVVAEPFGCAIRGIKTAEETGVDFSAHPRILIVGVGMIGFSVMNYLHQKHHLEDIVIVTKHPHQIKLVEACGYQTVQISDPQYVRKLGELCDAQIEWIGLQYQPRGGVSSKGGFDVVFECVGNEQAVRDASLFTAPNGYMIELGMPQEMRFDFNIPGMKGAKVLYSALTTRKDIEEGLSCLSKTSEGILDQIVTVRPAPKTQKDVLDAFFPTESQALTQAFCYR